MNFNFFDWVRNGVKDSVLLGVSDAIKDMNTAGIPSPNLDRSQEFLSRPLSPNMIHNRRDSDSVSLFIHAKGYQPDVVTKILLKKLYSEYVEYCRSSRLKAVSSKTLAARLRKLGYHVDRGARNLTFVFAMVGGSTAAKKTKT